MFLSSFVSHDGGFRIFFIQAGLVVSVYDYFMFLMITINIWFWSIRLVIASLISWILSLNLDVGVSCRREPSRSESYSDWSDTSSSLCSGGSLDWSCSTTLWFTTPSSGLASMWIGSNFNSSWNWLAGFFFLRKFFSCVLHDSSYSDRLPRLGLPLLRLPALTPLKSLFLLVAIHRHLSLSVSWLPL